MTIEDLLNKKSHNLEILKTDLVRLGESKEYIGALVVSYTQLYFQTEKDVLEVDNYNKYYKDLTNHLLDIVQKKYPINYEILKKEFGD